MNLSFYGSNYGLNSVYRGRVNNRDPGWNRNAKQMVGDIPSKKGAAAAAAAAARAAAEAEAQAKAQAQAQAQAPGAGAQGGDRMDVVLSKTQKIESERLKRKERSFMEIYKEERAKKERKLAIKQYAKKVVLANQNKNKA